MTPEYPTRYRGVDASPVPDVSIVVVSWNVRDLLRDCLASIYATSSKLRLQIIVVDNASVDGSVDMVRREFPGVRLVASERNLGFAAANNVGLSQARARYIFFLNPDTVLRGSALDQLVAFLDHDSGYDMVGPRLVYPDGTLQHSCARRLPTLGLILFQTLYLHRLPVLGNRLAKRLMSPYDLGRSQEVEAIAGAAMLARRDVVDALGGFDEEFLHTGEDMDLCLRLRLRGSKVFYLAGSEVVHALGASSAHVPVRSQTMSVLSMATYFRRSGGRLHAWVFRMIVQIIGIPLWLAVGTTKAMLSRDGVEMRRRLRLVRALLRWRVGE
jgi:GT2 family glycosyltransferase